MAQYSNQGSTSESFSGPVQTPQSEFSQQISTIALALGQYLQGWAQQVFAQTSTITDQIVNQFLSYASYAQNLASSQINQYQNVTLPEMNQLAQEAATYSSPARISYNMGAAQAGAQQASDAANQDTLQTLRGYGIDPSSGMYGDILAAQNTAAGAAAAGAGQAAEVNTENTGRQLLQNSITAGQQLPGDVVNELNSANNAVTAAENSVLSNANTGATLQQTAAPFFATAQNIKLPSQQSFSTSKSAGASTGGGTGGGSGSNKSALGNMGDGNPPGLDAYLGSLGSGGGQASQVELGNFHSPQGPPLPPFQTPEGADPLTLNFPDNLGSNFDPSQFQLPSSPQGMDESGFEDAFSPPSSNGLLSDFNPSQFQGDFQNAQDPGSNGGNYGSNFNSDFNPSQFQDFQNFQDPGNSGNYGGGYGDAQVSNFDPGAYARGGGVLPTGNPTTGGFVPPSASPSRGRVTDDIPARLNAKEFVIPRDVAEWKGQEFFHKLIEQSRRTRLMGTKASGAQGKPKPPLGGKPTFVSRPMGMHNGR